MKITDLYAAGTSTWLDDLSRAALTTTLPERIAKREVFGVTTNPAIFQAAIKSGKFQGMTWPTTPKDFGAALAPGTAY